MNFVTGGTGLLGSHLIYDLLLKGEKVKALKRSTSNLQNVVKTFSYYSPNSVELFDKIEWVEGDVLDYYSILEALKDVTKVYHCAAIVSFDPKQRERLIHDNVLGTANLINASIEHKIGKFCHVSSVSAVGRSENTELISEVGNWVYSKHKSAYGVSKHLSEMEVWRGIAEGLNAVIVNPSIILGPGNWNSGSSKLFSSIYKGLKYFTKGVSGYVDVRDVTKVMISLMDSKITDERYILNAENLSYEFVFKAIAKSLNVKLPHIYANKWMSELGWRLDKMKEIITNKPALISRETARTAHKVVKFSNQKIVKELDYQFIPIKQSIQDVSKVFLNEFKLEE